MTRTLHREMAEHDLIFALPGLDDAAKAALLRAVSRSYPPNFEIMGRARAEIERCKVAASMPVLDTPRNRLVRLARKLFPGRAG